jgi:hypothetical protein
MGGRHSSAAESVLRLPSTAIRPAISRDRARAGLLPEAGSIMTAIATDGTDLDHELNEFLDELFGPVTTEYRLCGRFHGVQIDISFDPLAYARRMIKESLREALPEMWAKRAEEFHQAMPRITDYRGGATRLEMFAGFRRCQEMADLCLQHAELLAADPIVEYRAGVTALLDDLDAVWHQGAAS